MYVLYVLTYCLRAIKQSEKAKANALKEEFIYSTPCQKCFV